MVLVQHWSDSGWIVISRLLRGPEQPIVLAKKVNVNLQQSIGSFTSMQTLRSPIFWVL